MDILRFVFIHGTIFIYSYMLPSAYRPRLGRIDLRNLLGKKTQFGKHDIREMMMTLEYFLTGLVLAQEWGSVKVVKKIFIAREESFVVVVLLG